VMLACLEVVGTLGLAILMAAISPGRLHEFELGVGHKPLQRSGPAFA